LRFLIDVAAISILEFRMQNRYSRPVVAGAFSSEVDTGSREENASKQESGASVLIQSEPIMLQAPLIPKFASEGAAIALRTSQIGASARWQ
jgi:hypothetical protein